MKIAELEAHHDAFIDSEQTISSMVELGCFPQVFSICTASFSHIIPAIRYRKKKGITPELTDLTAFTTIFKYAPALFEYAVIESLFEFINSSRVLLHAEADYLNSVKAARKQEQLAHRLWNHIEHHSGMLQRDVRTELGVIPDNAIEIIEVWEKLGILLRHAEDGTYRLIFKTRLDTELTGFCPNCGVHGKGRKELFFRPVKCQKCGTEGHYHIEYH